MNANTTRCLRLLVALLVFGFAASAHAQSLTGQLSGTVVDSSDAVLPGVTITLINELSGDQRSTVSNASGNFVFAAVPAGTYTVRAELSGFQTIETKGVVLRLGEKPEPHRAQAGRRRPDRAGGRHRRRRARADFLWREERDDHRRADSEHRHRRPQRGRVAEDPAGHGAASRAATARPGSTAKSSASTATARAASRARSATTRPTARGRRARHHD